MQTLHLIIYQLLLKPCSIKIKKNLYFEYMSGSPVIMFLLLLLAFDRLATGNEVPITLFQWLVLGTMLLLVWLTFDLLGLGYPQLFRHQLLQATMPKTIGDYIEQLPRPYKDRIKKYTREYEYDLPCSGFKDLYNIVLHGQALEEGLVYWQTVLKRHNKRRQRMTIRQGLRHIKPIRSNAEKVY